MTTLGIILTCIAIGSGLEWLLRNALALRVWRKAFHLTPDFVDEAPAEALPRLSVVVAAKDEEAHIGACLQSLLEQDYPDLEILVVNDRSADRTADIFEALAEQHDNLRMLTVTDLPEGWCGKNHAMHVGIGQARGEYLCMTDADCRFHSPRALRAAMAYAQKHHADMLSLLPTMQMGSFWEYFLQPIAVGVMMIWFPPGKVNDPRSRTAYANGMFMLLRRDAHDAVGGHEAIRSSLIEDMDLARNVKRAGLNLRTVLTRGLISVRMYTDLAGLTRGWVRIFLGSFSTAGRLLAALGVLWGRGLVPFVLCLVGWLAVAGGWTDGHWWWALAWAGSVALSAQLVMLVRYYGYTGSYPPLGLLYPVGCAWMGSIMLRALLKKLPGSKLTWRDTVYKPGA
jgi:cellulose synthase/poly-beta-1,6-N-acetylglucosamine synthase-like glycosyltransferase